MSDNENKEKEMTPEDRLNYLRERGILVETPEDRRRQQIKDIMNEPDEVDGVEYQDLKFVHIPHDESLPLKQLTMKIPKNTNSNKNTNNSKYTTPGGGGDVLVEELKPFFKALSKKVDMNLFQDQATKNFASSDAPQVSQEALRQVADQGQVETFTLVYPMESNHYTSIHVYLDEVGLLKRLPLNKRIAQLALKAGFNPPPKFYGDVFLGRMKAKPTLQNVDFKLGEDTSPNAKWLTNAIMENLEHQTSMNQIRGTTGTSDTQPLTDGENGIAKEEKGYAWTQTEEEVEITIPLDTDKKMTLKEVKKEGLVVKFVPKRMIVQFRGTELVSLAFFASVDPDGCCWTLDSDDDDLGTSLVVTCEKNDCISWPRIIA